MTQTFTRTGSALSSLKRSASLQLFYAIGRQIQVVNDLSDQHVHKMTSRMERRNTFYAAITNICAISKSHDQAAIAQLHTEEPELKRHHTFSWCST